MTEDQLEPKEIIISADRIRIKLQLPDIDCISEVNVEVSEKLVKLDNKHLCTTGEIRLPCRVCVEQSSVTFNTRTKCLLLDLPTEDHQATASHQFTSSSQGSQRLSGILGPQTQQVRIESDHESPHTGSKADVKIDLPSDCAATLPQRNRSPHAWQDLSEANASRLLAELSDKIHMLHGAHSYLQVCAQEIVRQDGSPNSQVYKKLLFLGPIYTDEAEDIAQIITWVQKRISNCTFLNGVIDLEQSPLPAAAIRRSYSCLTTLNRCCGFFDEPQQQHTVVTHIDTEGANKLILQAYGPSAFSGMLESEDGFQPTHERSSWVCLSLHSKRDVISTSLLQLRQFATKFKHPAVVDLVLEQLREDWRCGAGDEVIQGLRLCGHFPEIGFKEFTRLLHMLLARVSDLQVDVGVYKCALPAAPAIYKWNAGSTVCDMCNAPLKDELHFLSVQSLPQDNLQGATRPKWICETCETTAYCPGLLYEISTASMKQFNDRGTDVLADLRWQPCNIRPPLGTTINTGHSHPDAVCSKCHVAWCGGAVWRCAHCPNYLECVQCHQQRTPDRHDAQHIFIKIKEFCGGLAHLFPELTTKMTSQQQRMDHTGMNFFVPIDPNAALVWQWWMRRFFAAQRLSNELPSELRPPLSVQAPEILSDGSPQVLLLRGFLSPAECDHLIRLGMVMLRPGSERGLRQNASGLLSREAKEQDAIVKEIEERIAALVGIPSHHEEDDINLVFRPEAPDYEAHSREPMVLNLHLDARLGRRFSAVTVLVYLNDVSHGGGTIFPCVRQQCAVRDLFKEAFDEEQHFMDAADPGCSQRDAYLLRIAEHKVRGNEEAGGIITTPRRGCAVVFWTINPCGAANNPWEHWSREPYAWHGGVRVAPGGCGKWILQKFKELPLHIRKNNVKNKR